MIRKLAEGGFGEAFLMQRRNDALLVVENANIGWATLDAIIERGYKNLYQSRSFFSQYMAPR